MTQIDKIKITSPLDLKIESIRDKTLYHYTNNDALLNIIKGKSFWVSKAQFLNDPTELTYIEDVIAETCDKFIDPNNNGDLFFKERVSKKISNHLSFGINVYVLSLSENPDSLTLWASYSQFVGYNIGLDTSALIQAIKTQDIPYVDGKVIYNQEKQEEIIYNEIKPVYDYLKSSGQIKAGKHFIESTNHLNFILLMYSIFFKNPSFYPEEEYRIAFITDSSERQAPSLPEKIRTGNGSFIPFIEIPAKITAGVNTGKFPLQSITIGPKNNHDITKKGVEHLLEYLGFRFINIHKSKTLLRY
ncbi:DUF2971 domain-containing protein [Fictibacillus enclensis]|uniref:DUF2971 domain-containing protein n=1 Tax=Fictibacillus enclensis TaxID=1017270 RepID=UPI0025A2BEA8|nr:DUF2971 domain-containing protein [Fictibacillus enclensis]MDM5197878.1 DUF2971 domain-containing protein [Fictibacillus enclensis]